MVRLRNFVRLTLTSLLAMTPAATLAASSASPVHVWEKQEITLTAAKAYPNPYMDVTVWVDLTGPNFKKRVYGFWDGGRIFRVRILATARGEWTWTSGSTPSDDGLSGKTARLPPSIGPRRKKRRTHYVEDLFVQHRMGMLSSTQMAGPTSSRVIPGGLSGLFIFHGSMTTIQDQLVRWQGSKITSGFANHKDSILLLCC